MNSDFHLNSYRNFNSDFFHLVPSKFVTFGASPLNKINSGISDSISNKQENNIFLKQIPSHQSNKFKFDFDKGSSNNKRNDISSKDEIIIKQTENKEMPSKKNVPVYFNRSFQIGSKTVLNTINTCLLNLCSPSKNNNNYNNESIDNKAKTNQNLNYLINRINEENIYDDKDDNNINNNIISNSFLEKIKFSPVKKMSINKIGNEYDNIANNENENLIEINNQNDLQTRKNNNPSNNKFLVQGAFKAINNNYENPAKIQYHCEKPHFIPQNIISNNIPNITQISNITNVTNNYYFHYNNPGELLKKKTGRSYNQNNDVIIDSLALKKVKEKNVNNKSAKKDNLSYGLYQLNTISVNGVSISKFPVVSMNENDLEVHLLSKMLNETDYFTIVDKYYINIPVLDEEKYNKPSYDKVFKKEKEKISNLYLIGENLNENNPVNLIRNYYSQIKNKILNIQKNYLSNNKKALSSNIELCAELEKLIISCNAITNTVTDYKKSGLKRKLFLDQNDEDEKDKTNSNKKESKDNSEINNNKFENKNNIDDNNIENNIYFNNKKKKQKKKHFKTYLCEFCNKAYSNGQGLGGHMSRIHPNQSYKYKDKIRIRREREKKREKLLFIKRDLFKKYGFDYDKLINDKNKAFIQKFLYEHNEEYRNIRKNQQKEIKNNENISEAEEDKKIKNIFVTPLPKVTSMSKRKINCKEIINNDFSKEKTSDKTEFKIYDNKNMQSGQDNGKNEIGFVTKLKVNFELNKS